MENLAPAIMGVAASLIGLIAAYATARKAHKAREDRAHNVHPAE